MNLVSIDVPCSPNFNVTFPPTLTVPALSVSLLHYPTPSSSHSRILSASRGLDHTRPHHLIDEIRTKKPLLTVSPRKKTCRIYALFLDFPPSGRSGPHSFIRYARPHIVLTRIDIPSISHHSTSPSSLYSSGDRAQRAHFPGYRRLTSNAEVPRTSFPLTDIGRPTLLWTSGPFIGLPRSIITLDLL